MALFEVHGAVGHAPHHLAAGRTQQPLAVLALREGPFGHLAGGAVGKHPVGPVFIPRGKAASQLDGVDVKAIKHVVVDDRKLLDRIVDADRPRLQPQRLAELRVGDGRDTRRAMPAEIDGQAVGLLVVKGA